MYITTHAHSRTVGAAFAKGCGAPQVPSHRLQPEGDVAVYGRLRGGREILESAIRQGRTWWYIDRGYFRASHDVNYGGYFRVTRNALQHDGVAGNVDPARWRALQLGLQDWRTSGTHILVCPPGRVFASLSGFSADAWLRETLATLRAHTDRPVRVREKPQHAATQRNVALRDDLQDCWALVTHSSNAAVEAVRQGVPVICTAQCGASAVGTTDLTHIESPPTPDDRDTWAAVLANNQWTLAEFESGLAWEMLNGT